MGLVDFLLRIIRGPKVDIKEVEEASRQAQERRRRLFRQLRVLANRRRRLLEKAKKARKSGDEMTLDFVWEELKGLRTEAALLKKDARVAMLEALTLERVLRAMEVAQKTGGEGKIRDVIKRLMESGVIAKIGEEKVSEDAYAEELEAVLSYATETAPEEAEVDEEKAKFLEELDAIIDAEERGDKQEAKKRVKRLEKVVEKGLGEEEEER